MAIINSSKTVDLMEPVEGYYFWHCPKCRRPISPGQSCCDNCGQKIRWRLPLPEHERNGFKIGNLVYSSLHDRVGRIVGFHKSINGDPFADVITFGGNELSAHLDFIVEVGELLSTLN